MRYIKALGLMLINGRVTLLILINAGRRTGCFSLAAAATSSCVCGHSKKVINVCIDFKENIEFQ